MVDNSRHIPGSYDAALSALEDDIITMGSLCERNLRYYSTPILYTLYRKSWPIEFY